MHTERSLEYFPKVYPDGVPDRPLCSHLEGELVLAVDLPEEMEAKYREVESQGADTVRLRDCCNLSVHHTWALRPQKRHLMLEAAEQYARKLHEVAKTVWRSGEKAMAAASRRGGLQVLKELLRLYAPDDYVQIAVFSGHCSMIVSRSREEAVQPAEDTGPQTLQFSQALRGSCVAFGHCLRTRGPFGFRSWTIALG
ncbi:unnamed protein product [Durusdinium trenchii]|uniref:Uncharacterized protein n=1 Tax=Durusdinium trenchii TaxID=1381693 RepID=A0ABP0LQK8_9DINO